MQELVSVQTINKNKYGVTEQQTSSSKGPRHKPAQIAGAAVDSKQRGGQAS
jgi:hypothetical protein